VSCGEWAHRDINNADWPNCAQFSMASRGGMFWSGVWIFTVATGLASMIFMAWAFYVEITGRGALFIEPNKMIAAGELATVATGMIALLTLFVRSISRPD
jgi:hypothetical protein